MSLLQMISLAGAMMILAAFSLQQFDRWSAQDRKYLWANAIGASTLTTVAWFERQWGFLLMESVWTLVSVYGLVRLWVRRHPAAQ